MHCWVLLLASSASFDRRPGCADFCPQIFTNLRFCAQLCTQLPLVPVSVVPPLPSRLSHYTQLRRPHKARRFARFKVLRRIDRLEHSPSAARHLQIWSLRFVYPQLVLRLPLLDAVLDRSETSLSAASSQDAPMLPSTRCRCAGRSRVDSGRCSSDSP